MTTTDDLARVMEQERADRKREMLDAVNELATIASILKPLDARRELLRGQVKQYLELEGIEVLADGETGAAAKVQERHGQPPYDLVSAAATEDGEQAIMHAASGGYLRVDHAMLERFRKGNGATWADTLARYAGPEPITTALIITGKE